MLKYSVKYEFLIAFNIPPVCCIAWVIYNPAENLKLTSIEREESDQIKTEIDRRKKKDDNLPGGLIKISDLGH